LNTKSGLTTSALRRNSILQDSLDKSDSEDLDDFILEDSDQLIVYHINDTISNNCPHIDVSFGNVVIKCILDTGAQVTIMSERVYEKLILQEWQPWN
jgi:hypothetical protein